MPHLLPRELVDVQVSQPAARIGWYHSTDAAVRSKGTLYLSLNPHGDCAWGRWVGMSYDSLVVTGLGSIARTKELADQAIKEHLDQDGQ